MPRGRERVDRKEVIVDGDDDEDIQAQELIENFQKTLLKMTDKNKPLTWLIALNHIDKHLADLEEMTKEVLNRKEDPVRK
ncbi:unnamed protein product [Mesocestoides corti]|uniref:RNA polymerase sigma factor n=1 Tax=Mesocestoides corti TaxID=53468 RepID=A0A0R3UL66_MESCO|nr:unnamed protein product [Mesocestoides corti]